MSQKKAILCGRMALFWLLKGREIPGYYFSIGAPIRLPHSVQEPS